MYWIFLSVGFTMVPFMGSVVLAGVAKWAAAMNNARIVRFISRFLLF
jgi:hypothetical protein